MLKRLFHEPLLHFLILGGLLFLFYSFSEDTEEAENSIVISKERIEQLTFALEKKSLSILTKEEAEKMIAQEVYETVLYKEALKIGLSINDVDLKQHLVDKIAFILYDTYEIESSNDEVLKKFMLENSNDYREEEKISFTQNILGADIVGFEKEYTLSQFEISNVFGRSFAEVIFKLKVDGKVQKMESDYGLHEICITSKSIGKLKAFEIVKEQLQSDYLNIQREQKNKTIYETLKLKYSIRIEEN